MEQIVLPGLFCPFPSAVSQYAEEVHQGTIDWLRRFHVITDEASQRVSANHLGWLAARFHPDAPREELQLVSDWYAWFFFRDDQRDESEIGKQPERLAAVDARFLNILKGASLTDDDEPLAHAINDLRLRLRPRVTATWMRRFIRIVKEHFDSTVWEATNRARYIIPDVATYVRMRPLTGGMHVDAAFIEITWRIHLPPEVRGHPVVSALTLTSNNVVCWANDIFSLEKELKRDDVHNLVLVLQHTYQLDLQEAIERAAAMHDAGVRTFIDLEPRLPSFGSAVDSNLRRYVSTLRTRMRGNLDWAHESVRYQ